MPLSDSSGEPPPSPVVIRGGSTVTITIQIKVLPEDGSVEAGSGITDSLNQISEKVDQIMPTMQELRDAVQRNTAVDDSVLAMVQGIVQQLKDAQAANDPTAIAELISALDANTQKMSDAVTANTPAAPPTPAPVEPVVEPGDTPANP
jgi:enamine deaminase RidA (YjgF/YER057c/UK114 family)